MRRRFRVLGVAAATALFLGSLTAGAAAAPSQQVTITVVGVDRSGGQVAIHSTVVPLSGNAEPSTGPSYSLVPGTYYIGGSVPTTSGGNVASQTIVVRRVDVTSGGTIRLDARGGKLVSVWLDGRALGGPALAVGCIGRGRGVVYPDPQAPKLYVRPVLATWLGFDWALSTPGPGGSTYDLAGGTDAGLPGDPVYRLRRSALIKTVIQGRSGTLAGWPAVAAHDADLAIQARPGARAGRGDVVLPPGPGHQERGCPGKRHRYPGLPHPVAIRGPARQPECDPVLQGPGIL